MRSSDADASGGLQHAFDDADTLFAAGAVTDQPAYRCAQFRVGRQLLRFMPPFGDPLLQRLDLRVEQRHHGGGAQFAQRIADPAIGPDAHAEEGGKQQ